MIAHVRIFGIGFGQDLPPLTSGLLFAPEGIARTVLAARGIRARTELPERFGADDLMLLPGGPEVDDPWLHTGLGQGAEVRFGRPLVLELGLPQASVSATSEAKAKARQAQARGPGARGRPRGQSGPRAPTSSSSATSTPGGGATPTKASPAT